MQDITHTQQLCVRLYVLLLPEGKNLYFLIQKILLEKDRRFQLAPSALSLSHSFFSTHTFQHSTSKFSGTNTLFVSGLSAILLH